MCKNILVNNLKIYAFQSKKELLNYINNKKIILLSASAKSIIKNDSRFNKIANRHIAYTDGFAAVIALKQKGLKNVVQIPGVELWLDILNMNSNKKIYLLGGSQSVVENTAKKLIIDYPSINIVGYRNGYFTDETFNDIKNEILSLKPDIVLLALGQPKQEYIADDLYKIYPTLYMGLGGSFDIYCGDKKRAPKIFLSLHLEWFYRVLKEPMRIGRLLNLMKFLFLLKTKRL